MNRKVQTIVVNVVILISLLLGQTFIHPLSSHAAPAANPIQVILQCSSSPAVVSADAPVLLVACMSNTEIAPLNKGTVAIKSPALSTPVSFDLDKNGVASQSLNLITTVGTYTMTATVISGTLSASIDMPTVNIVAGELDHAVLLDSNMTVSNHEQPVNWGYTDKVGNPLVIVPMPLVTVSLNGVAIDAGRISDTNITVKDPADIQIKIVDLKDNTIYLDQKVSVSAGSAALVNVGLGTNITTTIVAGNSYTPRLSMTDNMTHPVSYDPKSVSYRAYNGSEEFGWTYTKSGMSTPFEFGPVVFNIAGPVMEDACLDQFCQERTLTVIPSDTMSVDAHVPASATVGSDLNLTPTGADFADNQTEGECVIEFSGPGGSGSYNCNLGEEMSIPVGTKAGNLTLALKVGTVSKSFEVQVVEMPKPDPDATIADQQPLTGAKTWTVKKGDTLSAIAMQLIKDGRTNLCHAQIIQGLMGANGLSYSTNANGQQVVYLHAGQTLDLSTVLTP